MKVYVVTEAKLFAPEKYITVKKSRKEAEKAIRDIYPYMISGDGAGGTKIYFSDSSRTKMLFIHEEEI